MKNIYLRLIISLLSIFSINSLVGQKLISTTPAGIISRDFLSFLFGANGALLENGIELYKITYTTLDVFGKPDTASGLIILPSNGKKSFFPVVYQHGTVDDRNDVPSNVKGGWEAGAVFAGLGYFTMLPDYLGLGTSRGYHPYVHAASQSWAATDMLKAAVTFAANAGITLNEKLFITGYSQGGHASMALHRDLEKNPMPGFKVAGAAHLSGPYSISTSMLDILLSDKEYGTSGYVPHTLLAYNPIYKLYTNLNQVIKPAYLDIVLRRQKEEIGLNQMNTLLTAALKKDYGKAIPSYIFQDSVVNNIKNNSNHPVRLALKDNDTYDWVPKAPTRILYCKADEQVGYTNAIFADSVMRARGAQNVFIKDLNSAFSHGQCVEPALLNSVLFFKSLSVSTSLFAVNSKTTDLKVYPNPASTYLYFENLPNASKVEWFNLQGQKMGNVTLDAGNELFIGDLSDGVYLFRAISGNEIFTGKVVIKK
ncbi:MAG: T9SS type A sorting domain-containing protein [Bacteroidota bacterium]